MFNIGLLSSFFQTTAAQNCGYFVPSNALNVNFLLDHPIDSAANALNMNYLLCLEIE